MSQENVEIVRRCYHDWARRNLSKLEAILDPDAVIDMSRNLFNPDVYHGHDGFRRWIAAIEDAWDDFEATPEEFIAGEGHVVTAVRISGRGRQSGAEVEMRVFNIWTLRDGKVVALTGGYRDRGEALEAAGLWE
jgi:ketosteroid isomerase-like protein